MSIKTSIGTSTANSYLSVSEADAYFETVVNNDSWVDIALNASTATTGVTSKENLLIQATRELDSYINFEGAKYNQGIKGAPDYQALHFPRTQDTDYNSDLYIIDDVKYATAEQANWIKIRGGLRTSETGEALGVQRNKSKIGNMALGHLQGLATRRVIKYGSWTK